MTGTITDTSGGVIAGASVVLTHTETGVRRAASTNQAGVYRFDAVDLGASQLKVTQPYYMTSTTRMVRVNANRITTIDARA